MHSSEFPAVDSQSVSRADEVLDSQVWTVEHLDYTSNICLLSQTAFPLEIPVLAGEATVCLSCLSMSVLSVFRFISELPHFFTR
jgi:hypothetical protein